MTDVILSIKWRNRLRIQKARPPQKVASRTGCTGVVYGRLFHRRIVESPSTDVPSSSSVKDEGSGIALGAKTTLSCENRSNGVTVFLSPSSLPDMTNWEKPKRVLSTR